MQRDTLIKKIASGEYTPDELGEFRKLIADLDTQEYAEMVNRFFSLSSFFPGEAEKHWYDKELRDKLLVRIGDALPETKSVAAESGRDWQAAVRQTGPDHPKEEPAFSDKNADMSRRVPYIRRGAIWRAAAAVLVGCLTVALFVLIDRENKVFPDPHEVAAATPVPVNMIPGGEKALLTLSNGETIVLDSTSEGLVTQQGVVEVVKLSDGQISYRINGSHSEPESLRYNTMSTPRGGQYCVTLADGTKVWLNAASSVTYPALFSGKERKVSITGEVYFEVAENKQKPFHVEVNGMEVVVLGTHFNVNAYENELTVKTTLLEGSVQVVTESAVQQLKPGEQARLEKNGSLKVVNNINVEESVAWKNGFFSFADADIQTVMRQLERWFDIEVRYQGNAPSRRFQGEIGRDLTLDQILKILDKMNVHFKMEGRTLVVIAK